MRTDLLVTAFTLWMAWSETRGPDPFRYDEYWVYE